MLDLSDRLCYKRIYNHCFNVSFDLSDLYYLGMATDLSQSLSLNIHQRKDYMSLISTADQVDLVLFYSFITTDRFQHDIGSKINDMSSATNRSAIIYRFNCCFLVFILVDCRIKLTGMLTDLKAIFWTCIGVKQIFQDSVCFFINTDVIVRWSSHPRIRRCGEERS